MCMALSSASIIANTSSTPATARLNNSSRLLNYSTEAVLAANHHIGLSLNFPRSNSSPLVCTARAVSQQVQQLVQENHRKHAPAIDGTDRVKPISSPTSFTSTGPDPALAPFWNTHKEGLLQAIEKDANSGITSSFLTAELQLLANAASDRAEMHSILAQQRDNWNKLFQRMLTSASMTACVLSGLDGYAGHSMGLSLPALLLNAGTAAMMTVINQFQPSQLAEEQRTAARLFRKLASDVYYALHVSPHLRQRTSLFVDDCKRRLQALDKAFPMPLTPGGLEKFPTKVVPPVLIEPKPILGAHQDSHVVDCLDQYNGWDTQLTQDLKHIAAMLHHSDIPKYTGWAQNLVKVNKCLAIAAPCFAASAALLNAAAMCTTVLPTNILGMWAATFSVLATFLGSFSNDMQLGMVFELYRNSAGYYADLKTTIEETLDTPVEQRENGTLFRQRIAYQLGRWPTSRAEPVVPAHAKEAGTLF
ncbi:hypothetical protein GOP47_0019242 [Adiantum capillus-veneris]|uniref:F-box protein n=1 Tax=Adiantum capillus-veneris TaxID=13818 RepID=A0A9D4UFN6_ADICA|nr:hypothetical protein GOP47_0019242 [Adiantum capillus-veneris]